MKISVYGSSSAGKVRKLNEDSYSFDSSSGDKGSIFVVCDGMGGHKAGEVASNYTSIKIVEYFHSSLQKDILTRLNESIRKANNDLYKLSKKDSSKRSMGTTVVVVVVFGNILYFANVGDSRAYLVRNNSIGRLTKDHSWLEERISDGSLRPSEARNNPNKNIITKCVGYEPDIEPYYGSYLLKEGDRIILCSDGLWDELTDSEIKNIALSSKDLRKSIEKLIISAEEHGGSDNITVLGIDYGKVRVNILNKYRHLILLSIISAIAVFFIVLSVVLINFTGKSRSENKILQNQLTEQIENSNRWVKENQRLKEDIEKLKKENEKLIGEIEIIENQNNPEVISETPEIIEEKVKNLELKEIIDPKEYFENFSIMKKLYIYNKNFLFLNASDKNNIFFINNNNKNIKSLINFRTVDGEENIEINDIVFDSNSERFYLISTNYFFKGNVENLFSGNTVVDVDIATEKELPENIIEGNFAKYLIIEEQLYYFIFNIETGQVEYYRFAESNNELSTGIIKLEIAENTISPVKIVDISYDSLNKRLFILVISDETNSLYIYQETNDGFEKKEGKDISTGIPQKLLINSQDNSGPLVYFKDDGFYAYDYKLDILGHYFIDTDNNPGISGVKEACIDGSMLYILGENDIIFSYDFNQE